MFETLFHKLLLYKFFILGSLSFYFLLCFLCKYFLRKVKDDEKVNDKSYSAYIKHDVLISIAIYSICIIWFFYPYFRSLNVVLIGAPGDNQTFCWNIWWITKVISNNNLNLFFSNYIFYPNGVNLLYNDLGIYNIFVTILLKALLNLNHIFIYNLLILSSFLIAGLSAFFLTRYLTKSSYLGFISGFIFAFCPFHSLRALGHLHMASIQFIPFFVLFYIKAIRGYLRRDLFFAAVFLFLTAGCTWYYLVYSLYFIGLSYIYLSFRRKRIFLGDVLLKTGIISGSAIIWLMPLILKMIYLSLKYPEIRRFGGHENFVADTLGLVTPPFFHVFGNIGLVTRLVARFTDGGESCVYLGVISIILVLSVFKKIIRKTAKYFCGLLAFFVLAGGVNLHVAGYTMPIFLPHALIRYVPFLASARAPTRAIVYVYLFWSIIVATAVGALFSFMRPSKKRVYVMVLLIGLLILDYYPKYNAKFLCTVEYPLSSCYRGIKKEGSVFGILDLPLPDYKHMSMLWNTINSKYMFYQTKHGFPIVGGMIARDHGNLLSYHLETDDLALQKKQLMKNKVKYIIIHKEFVLEKDLNDYVSKYRKQYDFMCEDDKVVLLRVY